MMFAAGCASRTQPRRRFAATLIWLAVLLAPGAAQQPSAELAQAMAAYDGGDVATALTLLRQAVDRGEAEAMVNLGYLYARGQGVARDPAAALALYRRAAAMGDGEGMNAVGFRAYYAQPPDVQGAIHWWCLAIQRGNSRAMANLAGLYAVGQGVPRDPAEARDLWQQSAARGDVGAAAVLGQDLAADATLPVAVRQHGMALLQQAARQGNARAQAVLRKAGDNEEFPPGFDTSLLMRPEPHDGRPGHSRACGELMS
jgi:uncharacterized protein